MTRTARSSPTLSPSFARTSPGRSLPSKWKREVGATNGTGGESTKIEIDRAHGASESSQSLKLSDFRSQANSYPASGSFCGWFIAEHGLESFKAMYPLPDPSAKAEELFGRRLEDMEADWHAEIVKFK